MVVLERQDHLPVIGDDPEAFTPRGIGDGGRRVPVFSSVLQIAHTERQHSFPVGADQRIGIFAVLLHADPCVGKAEARSHVELTGDYVIDKVKGERHRSKFLQKLAFGSYNRRIADKRTANDWLTKNTEMVDAYNRDKYCTFLFTVNGYQTLFDVLGFIQKKENIEKIPKNLPVYMIAGEEDPVGNYGKGVEKVFEEYRKCGIRDLELKLYEDDRHEILNELDRENVYLDVKNWILKHI